MAIIDKSFHKLCSKILSNGKEYNNIKRGVKRLQIPSYTFRHQFAYGFPVLTNKKIFIKGVVGELIWFLRGDNNVKYLNENGINIWNKDAYNWYKKNGGEESYENFEKVGIGSVGQNYSVQYRNYNGETDQIKSLIHNMKKDIMSSQLIVNAWNPSELNETALPPCHAFYQIIGVPLSDGNFGFELHWLQRSVDTFLGLPFNIASYATLAKILERITGFKALAIQGDLKCVHFYDNQYDAVKELLSRDTEKHSNCEIKVDFKVDDDINLMFENLKISDFKLVNYTCDKPIKVDMVAPITL